MSLIHPGTPSPLASIVYMKVKMDLLKQKSDQVTLAQIRHSDNPSPSLAQGPPPSNHCHPGPYSLAFTCPFTQASCPELHMGANRTSSDPGVHYLECSSSGSPPGLSYHPIRVLFKSEHPSQTGLYKFAFSHAFGGFLPPSLALFLPQPNLL